MMVGYWELDSITIFESFITGNPLKLEEPDQVDGPGCIECGLHWTSAKNTPCEAYEERPHDVEDGELSEDPVEEDEDG